MSPSSTLLGRFLVQTNRNPTQKDGEEFVPSPTVRPLSEVGFVPSVGSCVTTQEGRKRREEPLEGRPLSKRLEVG